MPHTVYSVPPTVSLLPTSRLCSSAYLRSTAASLSLDGYSPLISSTRSIFLRFFITLRVEPSSAFISRLYIRSRVTPLSVISFSCSSVRGKNVVNCPSST